ncbi:MAG: pseudouridylate synthase [Spirochaetales bacterium]|nr:pseudouridylate synthase [Spirochaetales bacterium]
MNRPFCESQCKVLFADDDICVVLKPPGMFVHPSALDRKLPDCRTYLEAEYGTTMFNVHRIDRPASGLVLFARTKTAAATLSAQFRLRKVTKRYLAIVRGHMDSSILIAHPLSPYQGAKAVDAVSVASCLDQSVLNEPVGIYQEGWFSLTQIVLQSGRRHQARRHFKHIGHPIIGDTQYGDNHQNRFIREKFGFMRLYLRASFLAFTHPSSQLKMMCHSGLPSWWLEILGGLGLRVPSEIPTAAEVR